LAFTNTGTTLLTSSIELINPNPADFDGDGAVDYEDLQVIAGQWLQSEPPTGLPLEADIAPDPNGDGIVNFKDFAVFAQYWTGTTELPLIVEGAELIEVYSSAGKYFEGPTWDPVTNKLYFTNRTNNQLLRLDSPGIVTVWMSNTPYTNGTFLSLEGRLLTADENPRKISSHRIGASGPEDSRVLADQTDGIDKQPNDLCQTENGNIYFTGPDWGAGPNNQGVYLLKTDGTVARVASGLYQPNGTIASNDGTKLYVAESSSSNITKKRWWVFPINPDGMLGTGTVFFKPASPPSNNDPDGMTIDERGNLYFAGLGGIWIVSPLGEQLEMVPVPEFCSNITFGGPENKTLYMTCQNKVYSLQMNVHGGGF
jgi:gluconolactonase